MNILAIDTSTKNFSLAVIRNDKLVAERNVVKDKILSSSIIPEIDRILKKSKLSLAKLDAFVVGLGPGSFTSLRVGLATVKGLAFASKKPVIAIPTLDAIAYNVRNKNSDQICVIVDAKRNLVYTCSYQRQNGELKRQSKYLLTAPDDVLQKIQGQVIFTGDGVGLFRDKIVSHGGICENEKYWHPQARSLWELAKPRIEKKKFDDVDRLVPMYLYPEDCQVQR